MSVPNDYMVRCPQCGSDDIFTMSNTPMCKLPVRYVRECRKCKYKFYTKFDKYTTDILSLAKATTFKDFTEDVWTGLFITGMYDTEEEAIQAQLEELVSECRD